MASPLNFKTAKMKTDVGSADRFAFDLPLSSAETAAAQSQVNASNDPSFVTTPHSSDMSEPERSSNMFVRGWEGLKSTVADLYHDVASVFADMLPTVAVAAAATAAVSEGRSGAAYKGRIQAQNELRNAEAMKRLAERNLAKAKTEEDRRLAMRKARQAKEEVQRLQIDAENKKEQQKEDDEDAELLMFTLLSGHPETAGEFERSVRNGITTDLEANRLARRAAQIERWEKMEKNGGFIARNYAKARLGIAAKQSKFVAFVGDKTEKFTKPFVTAGEKISGAVSHSGMALKEAVGLGEGAAKALKVVKPLAKVGRIFAVAGAAIAGTAVAVIGAPALATIGAVVGIAATVGLVAGAGLSAYATYKSTGSLAMAALDGADFIIPVRGVRDLARGEYAQAVVDTSESLIGGGALANKAINALHYASVASTTVAVAQGAATTAEFLNDNPEMAKMAKNAVTGHLDQVAEAAGTALNARHGDKAAAVANVLVKNNPTIVQSALSVASNQPSFGAIGQTGKVASPLTEAANDPVQATKQVGNGAPVQQQTMSRSGLRTMMPFGLAQGTTPAASRKGTLEDTLAS